MGLFQDKYLNMAASYLEYLGTDKYTPEQIKEEFYKLGCSFGMGAGYERSFITISGLYQNMEAAMTLFEHVLHNAKPNEDALKNLVQDVFKARENAKSNQRAIVGRLFQYGMYGAKSPTFYTQLSTKELNALKSELLINKLKEWANYKQFAVYYGPDPQEKVIAAINKIHDPKNLKDVPPEKVFPFDVPTKDRVYVVHYELPNQVILRTLSFGDKYQKELSPSVHIYNEYFGTLAYEELRESRALAYQAGSYFMTPDDLHELYINMCVIVCGTDKLQESIDAFNELLTNMPENETSFTIAKNAAIDNYRTQRITPRNVIWNYLAWQKLGLKEDPRKANFDIIQRISLLDIKQFQANNITGKPRTFLLFGNTKDMDMKSLQKIGKVKVLKIDEIFGY